MHPIRHSEVWETQDEKEMLSEIERLLESIDRRQDPEKCKAIDSEIEAIRKIINKKEPTVWVED